MSRTDDLEDEFQRLCGSSEAASEMVQETMLKQAVELEDCRHCVRSTRTRRKSWKNCAKRSEWHPRGSRCTEIHQRGSNKGGRTTWPCRRGPRRSPTGSHHHLLRLHGFERLCRTEYFHHLRAAHRSLQDTKWRCPSSYTVNSSSRQRAAQGLQAPVHGSPLSISQSSRSHLSYRVT